MRLARFDADRTGVVLDGDTPRVVDVAAGLDAYGDGALKHFFPDGGTSWLPLIEGWSEAGPLLSAFAEWASGAGEAVVKPLDAVRLRPPLPAPTSRIFAMGVNFKSHVASASKAVGADASIAEQIAQRPPAGFFVIPGTIIGPDDDFSAPPGAEKIDVEAEVGAVLANGGRNVAAGDFGIWGYTGWNDISIRDPHLGVGLSELDKGTLAWGLQKNWDGGNACGAFMVVGEGDPATLRVQSRRNGEPMQDGSTSEMIRSFGQAAEYISRFLAIQPGDMFISGTPAGTAIEHGLDGPFVQPGDVIEVEIERAGVLRNRRAG